MKCSRWLRRGLGVFENAYERISKAMRTESRKESSKGFWNGCSLRRSRRRNEASAATTATESPNTTSSKRPTISSYETYPKPVALFQASVAQFGGGRDEGEGIGLGGVGGGQESASNMVKDADVASRVHSNRM